MSEQQIPQHIACQAAHKSADQIKPAENSHRNSVVCAELTKLHKLAVVHRVAHTARVCIGLERGTVKVFRVKPSSESKNHDRQMAFVINLFFSI